MFFVKTRLIGGGATIYTLKPTTHTHIYIKQYNIHGSHVVASLRITVAISFVFDDELSGDNPQRANPINDLPNYIQLFTNLADSLMPEKPAQRTIKTYYNIRILYPKIMYYTAYGEQKKKINKEYIYHRTMDHIYLYCAPNM